MSKVKKHKKGALLSGLALGLIAAVSPYAGAAQVAGSNAAGSSVTEGVIQDIKVYGLNRVSLGAVLLALPVRQGDVLTGQAASLSLKRLFATGNFDDVSLNMDGNTLVIRVQERPTISSVEFVGNEQINEEALRDIIEKQGMRPGEALNAQLLDNIKRSLEDFYHSAGMYRAEIKPVINYLPRNRVSVELQFNEGEPAAIEQINIIGNKAFDEEELKGQLDLRDDLPWWNVISNTRYDAQKFSGDLEKLKSFYTDRGYVKFKIESTQVSMTPDRKGLYLTIVVNEGDQYTFGKTSIRGNTLKYGEELQSLINIEEGSTYSARTVSALEKSMSNHLGKYGYAYSQVTAVPEFDEQRKVVDINFIVQPGQRIYVSDVNISGNTNTNDVVIRRELRQTDGSWLSTEAVDTSKTRLNRTGFFETADISIKRSGNSADTVSLETTVKEQPTGSIQGSVGFGTSSGFMLSAGISQNNVFGWGTRASINAYQNDYREHVSLGYTDPYFTVDQVSLGGQAYYDNFHGDDADVVNYDKETLGFSMTTGYPLSETMYISYTLGYETIDLKSNKFFMQALDFWNVYGGGSLHGSFDTYNLGVTFSRNALNRTVFPTSGSRQSLSFTMTAPQISDLQYYIADLQTFHYFPLNNNHDFVFAIRGRAAYGDGYGNVDGLEQKLPFFNNLYLGGDEWLRGFKRNSVGPRALYPEGEGENKRLVPNDDDNLGGNALWAVSAEIIVPTPLVSEAYKNQVRTALFIDAGCLWDTHADDYTAGFSAPDYGSPSNFSAAAGIGLTWMSPVGPLSFNFAKALKEQPGDDSQVFSFEIGGRF